MDNQNTNGLGGMNTNNGSNETITPNPNPETMNTNEGMSSTIGGLGNTPVTPTLQDVPNQSAEPVKPTLDSILNGTPNTPNQVLEGNTVSSSMPEARPIAEEPVIEQVPPVTSIPDIPVVDTSASTMDSKENTVTEPVAPVIESIPDTPIEQLQNVAPVSNESVVETLQSSIPQNASVTPTETISTPQPATPVLDNQVETLDETTNATETPVIENLETVNSGIPNTPQDDFGAVPVPPVFDDGKKKKNKEKKERNKEDSKKTIIVVLIFVLIVAIGFGVYYFLTMAKASSTKASLQLKDVKLELGSTMSSNIEDYATITGYDKTNCSIDLSQVDVNKVSTYKYQVTCGKVNQEGTIIVDDTMAPKVATQDVVLLPNATLNPEDFIEKCTDASSCSYKFLEDYTGLTEKVGEYEVQIVVSDNFNNEAKVSAKLKVDRNAPVKYLTCTSKETPLEEIPASVVYSYRIGVDAKDNFFNAVRTSLFTYTTLEDYNNAVRNYDASVGIQGIIGTEILNEAEKSIAIKTDKTLKDMNQDINGNLPENASILRAYLFGIGYTCN